MGFPDVRIKFTHYTILPLWLILLLLELDNYNYNSPSPRIV